MSGGYFDYNQFRIDDIRSSIKRLIKKNHSENRHGDEYHFSEETIKVFEKTCKLLKKASRYTHLVDHLVSGDDSEESFHERLKEK